MSNETTVHGIPTRFMGVYPERCPPGFHPHRVMDVRYEHAHPYDAMRGDHTHLLDRLDVRWNPHVLPEPVYGMTAFETDGLAMGKVIDRAIADAPLAAGYTGPGPGPAVASLQRSGILPGNMGQARFPAPPEPEPETLPPPCGKDCFGEGYDAGWAYARDLPAAGLPYPAMDRLRPPKTLPGREPCPRPCYSDGYDTGIKVMMLRRPDLDTHPALAGTPLAVRRDD